MSDQAKEFVQKIFDENYTKFEKLSTVLFKNRRYKIIEKKKPEIFCGIYLEITWKERDKERAISIQN